MVYKTFWSTRIIWLGHSGFHNLKPKVFLLFLCRFKIILKNAQNSIKFQYFYYLFVVWCEIDGGRRFLTFRSLCSILKSVWLFSYLTTWYDKIVETVTFHFIINLHNETWSIRFIRKSETHVTSNNGGKLTQLLWYACIF